MSIGAGPQLTNYNYGFANGVAIRGLPIVQTQTGRVFWVYNGANLPPGGRGGSDNNRGTFDSPFATVAGALPQCLAARGDIIFVKAGHAENITAAAALLMNISGIQVVGLGSGNQRPIFTWTTAAAASISVTAAQVSFSNCVFDMTGVAAVTSGFAVSAADFSLIGCDIITASATNQAVTALTTTAAADRLTVDSCRFRGSNNAGTTAAITIVGGDSHQIINNLMIGNYTLAVGAINNITTACTNALVDGNRILNNTAASTNAAAFVAGSTGILSNNRIATRAAGNFTAAGMFFAGNFATAAPATASTLL